MNYQTRFQMHRKRFEDIRDNLCLAHVLNNADDSYFSSVKTAIALHQHYNLRFMGIVKTTTREYPMSYLKQWYNDGSVRDDNNEFTRPRESCYTRSKFIIYVYIYNIYLY